MAAPARVDAQDRAAASGTVALRLVVPLHCRADFRDDAPGSAGGRTGILRTFCNSARGFRIIARYAPGSLRDAIIELGGAWTRLDGSGHTVIQDSATAQSREARIRMTAPAPGAGIGTIAFEIEPH